MQNINIMEERPETMPPLSKADPRLKSDPGKDRTEEGAALPEPFTQKHMQQALGLTSGGANSQVRRWMYWGWVVSAGFGAYRRTANFGGEKKSVGYTRTGKKSAQHYTSKGKLITASLPCDFPGCAFVGHGSSEINALRSVGRHKSMEHGIKKKYVSAAERRRLGVGKNTKYLIPRPGMNGTAAPAPEAPAPAPQPEHHIRFCPECGYNIQMHEISYRIARKHRKES